MNSGTGQDVVDFLSFTIEKGLMNGNTAGALRSAVREVLSAVDGDDWVTTDVRSIDLEDYGTRFERLRMSKYKPESLNVYRARFRNGVQMYLEWEKDPRSWRYKAERPSASRKKSEPSKSASKSEVLQETSVGAAPPAAPGVEHLVAYPYPLRPGMLIKLHLPTDLSRVEARRLSTFIESLAVDEQLALPPAHD